MTPGGVAIVDGASGPGAARSATPPMPTHAIQTPIESACRFISRPRYPR